MFCIKCGKQIDDSANFCVYCGNVVKSNDNVSNTPQPTYAAPVQPQTPVQEQNPFAAPVQPQAPVQEQNPFAAPVQPQAPVQEQNPFQAPQQPYAAPQYIPPYAAPQYTPPYAAPTAPQAKPSEGLGVAAMILGIVGVVMCWVIALFGYILGGLGLTFAIICKSKNKESKKATVGMVLSIVTLGCSVLNSVLGVLLLLA